MDTETEPTLSPRDKALKLASEKEAERKRAQIALNKLQAKRLKFLGEIRGFSF